MSIIIAAAKGSKKHVTRTRGYRLHPISDGVAVGDEVFGRLERTPGGWTGPRDWLADEQARRSRETTLDHPDYVMRVVDPFDVNTETLVRCARPAPKAAEKRPKSGSRTKSGSRRMRNADVDAWIRAAAPEFTGDITPTMRKLARDVISHQESVARYTGEL